jgi:hypothetical protein
MAYSVTTIRETVFGNQRVTQLQVTADAASGAVDAQMGVVESVQVTPISMATAAGKFKPNLNAASAASNGNVFVSSVAAGDVFFMTVYGR